MPRCHFIPSSKSVAVGFLLVLVSLLAPACSEKGINEGPTPVLSGPPSTTFPMPPAANGSLSELGWVVLPASPQSESVTRKKIGEFRGKILVLDMYATWCVPCRQSIPKLVELQSRYQNDGLEIVGLNVGGPDDRVKVVGFAQELGITYSLGFPDKQLTDLLMFDDLSIPQTFVFGRDGTLLQRFIGYSEIANGKLEALIQSQTSPGAR
jgi:thiol-disulfide isomerase/thioredoxin